MIEARLRRRGRLERATPLRPALGLARVTPLGTTLGLTLTAALALTAAFALTAALVLTPAPALPASAAGTATPAATDTGLVWSVLSPSSSPPALQYASAVYDSDNKTIVLFGGLTSQGTLSDSTWVWNGTNWTDYSPAQIEEPPARYLASMAFDPALHQLILFGGRDPAGHQLSDTWAWNGASWYNVAGHGPTNSPGARDGAALANDGQGHLVLFGGEGVAASATTTTAPSPSAPTSGSTKYTPTAGTRNAADTSGANPGATASANATPGAGAPSATTTAQPTLTALGDTWLWGSGGWSQVATPGPPARVGATATFDAGHGNLVLFGGTTGLPGTAGAAQLGDTWIWNGSGWAQAAGGPTARSSAVMAYDSAVGGVVLCGGTAGPSVLGDTWLWNGATWSQVATDGSQSGRVGAAGAFDPVSRQLVVFGGSGPNGGLLGTTAVLTAGAPTPLGLGTTVPPGVVTLPGHSPSSGGTAPTALPSTGGGVSVPQRSRALAEGGHPTSSKSNGIVILRPGQLVTLTGAGFSPKAELTITFHSTPVVVGKTETNAQGAFVVTVPVPAKAVVGTHRFEASGPTPSGQATLIVATVEVVSLASSSSPSFTETIVLVLVAILVPVGTWILLGARSRRRASV